MIKIVLIIIYLILTVSGLIFMKKGGNSGSLSVQNGDIIFGINWISAIGFICYIGSFLLFTRLVMIFDLSYIMPIATGMTQILSLIASYTIFKDQITKQGIIGAILVIAGIMIMNFNTNKI